MNEINIEYILKSFKTIDEYTKDNLNEQYCAYDILSDNTKYKVRKAKTTPKKFGQFVTFYKRIDNINTAYETNDDFDYLIVFVIKDGIIGKFSFTKQILKDKGILTFNKNKGKMAFRVYPSWDKELNKQAQLTQKWQLDYFKILT